MLLRVFLEESLGTEAERLKQWRLSEREKCVISYPAKLCVPRSTLKDFVKKQDQVETPLGNQLLKV
jgi:hypothetical protein